MIFRSTCHACGEPLEDHEFEYCDPCLFEMEEEDGAK